MKLARFMRHSLCMLIWAVKTAESHSQRSWPGGSIIWKKLRPTELSHRTLQPTMLPVGWIGFQLSWAVCHPCWGGGSLRHPFLLLKVTPINSLVHQIGFWGYSCFNLSLFSDWEEIFHLPKNTANYFKVIFKLINMFTVSNTKKNFSELTPSLAPQHGC